LRDRGFPISDSAIVQGIESALHPGRLELMEGSPSILLDGAHNPSGARALTRYLSEFVHVPITMVFGAMSDKRLDEIAAELFPFATRLVLTRPDNPRAASVSKLKELATKMFILHPP
jgi:dihydrofolate synthase/folylpolyglutamate synthase